MPEASFDHWSVIFLLAASQGIFLGSILILRQWEKPVHYTGILVFLFSVTLIEYVAFWTNFRFEYPHINRISVAFPFLFGPLIYWYIKSFLNGKIKIRKHVPHLIPFFLFLLYQIPYYLLSGATKNEMLITRSNLIFESQFLIEITNSISFAIPWLMILHLSVYASLTHRLIKNFDFRGFSLDPKRLSNLVVYGFYGFILCFASYYIMVYGFSYVRIYDYYISFAMSGFIFGLGYMCLVKPELANGFISDHLEKDKYSNSGLTEEQAEKLKLRLRDLMEKEELFLNSNLKLTDLAEKLNESKHHVSQVLNEELNTTFSNFVNQYRINSAQNLLKKNSDTLNMFGVAKESGFNNKTTFNLAFKRHTGCTPTEFKQKALNGKSN